MVTASRTDEQAKDSPQAIRALTGTAIAERQAQTPNQMLREEPGIWSVLVNAQGSPIIRGQIGNRVLYLWDGVRLNNGALFSGPNGYFNQFPIGSVERMARQTQRFHQGRDAAMACQEPHTTELDPVVDPLKRDGV